MYFILANYFLLFLLYAFMGWCMEVIVVYFSTKKFVDRGFLIGPICPIYGLVLLSPLENYVSPHCLLPTWQWGEASLNKVESSPLL